jgi:hypothetical protein
MLINPLGLFQICDPWLKNKENRFASIKKYTCSTKQEVNIPLRINIAKGGVKSQVLKTVLSIQYRVSSPRKRRKDTKK